MKSQQRDKRQQQPNWTRERTNMPGQNPKQNDAVDHDLYHDEGRINRAKNSRRS
jgi:hypothetical protein